jgi:Bacterial lectin
MKVPILFSRAFSVLIALAFFLIFGAPHSYAQNSFGYPPFPTTAAAGLQTNSWSENAGIVNGVLQLTSSGADQVGSAWYTNPSGQIEGAPATLSLASGFTTTFTFAFTNPGTNCCAPGADGIAFVVQNGSFSGYNNDTTSGAGALGPNDGLGGEIGFTGLTNSVAVEFDTFCNGEYADTCASPASPTSADQVTIESCGTAANTVTHGTVCQFGTIDLSRLESPIYIGDANTHTAQIQYVPPTTAGTCSSGSTLGTAGCGTLTVIVDGQTVLTEAFNLGIINGYQDQTDAAFVGFTGATGGSWETQDIQSWSFSQQTIVGSPLQPGTQNFDFNTTPGSLDIVSTIIPTLPNGQLTNQGAIPFITAFSVPPSNPSSLWANSPLATASCIPLVSAGGNCAPKLVVCTTSTNMTPSGVNCPYDSTGAEDVLLSDQFDPVTPITSSNLTGNPGVVALNDTQGCPFAGVFATLPCPSNGLKSFSGDPAPVHGSSNSYYYYVTGILAPSTTVSTTPGFVNVNGHNWINGNNPLEVTLTATPPAGPGSNGWYPSPIDYIAYANVNLSSNPTPPNPEYPLNLQNPPQNSLGGVAVFSENSQSSGVVTSSGPSTTGSTCVNVLGTNGSILPASSAYSFPVQFNLSSLKDTDTYALYYETEDCTRTAERIFTYSTSTPGWTTSYKSVVYTVDDDPPTISITVPSSGAIYPANATIASSFNCSDGAGSGVATCNGPSQLNTTPTGGILTPETFTVTSSDNVGNITNPPNGVTVNYFVSCLYAENTVSPATFARGQSFTITPSVTNCTKSLQPLTVSVVLSGPMGASCATKMLTLVNGVTLPIPAGVSLKATFGPFSVPKNACPGTYTFTTTSSTKGVTDFTYSSSLTVN